MYLVTAQIQKLGCWDTWYPPTVSSIVSTVTQRGKAWYVCRQTIAVPGEFIVHARLLLEIHAASETSVDISHWLEISAAVC